MRIPGYGVLSNESSLAGENEGIPALTLHQPWASLIATGTKTIETRSWSASYRGRLAIHAGKSESALHYLGWLEEHQGEAEPALIPFADRITMTHAHRHGVLKAVHDLPLGAIVATCTLKDVAPIGEWDWFRTGVVEGDEGDLPGKPVVVTHPRYGAGADTYRLVVDHNGRVADITDQLPYGDFTPGRFAWLLSDVKPVDPPVPAKGRQGLWTWTP